MIKINVEKIVIAVGLLALVPFIILSFYNHPMSDDFGFANIAKDYGFIGAIRFFYLNIKGCILVTSLLSIGPLVFDWWAGYKIIPVVFLIFIFIALLYLIKKTSQGLLSTISQLALAFSFLWLYLYNLKNIGMAIFWLPTLAGYQLGDILMIFFLSVLVISLDMSVSRRKLFIIGSILIAMIMHTIETHTFLMVSVLGLLLFIKISLKLSYKMVLGWLILSICIFASVYFAPGTSARGDTLSLGHDVWGTIVSIAKYGSSIFINSFPSLLLFSIILFSTFENLTSSILKKYDSRFIFLHPIFSFLIMILLPILTFIPACWVAGSPFWGRIHNTALFYLLLSWGYFMITVTKYYANRISSDSRNFRIAQLISLFLVIVAMFGPNNIRAAVGDLYLGRAKNFDTELKIRNEIIRNSNNDTVYVAPLKNLPASLYVDDISNDPNDWRNQINARFFQKKAIISMKKK